MIRGIGTVRQPGLSVERCHTGGSARLVVKPVKEVHETGSADTGPVVGSAHRLYRQITELIDSQQYPQITELIDSQQRPQITELIDSQQHPQITELQQYRRPSDRLLHQPIRQAYQLPPLVQEPAQHAISSQAESGGSKGEEYYREVYTTWVEIGSIAVEVLAGNLVGQEHTGVLFDTIVAMGSSYSSTGRVTLSEIDTNAFKVSGDLAVSISDIIELSKHLAATDRDDPLRVRKLATLGRMITEIPGLKAQLVRLRENRTIAFRSKNSKTTK
jgi:hypothetical protein